MSTDKTTESNASAPLLGLGLGEGLGADVQADDGWMTTLWLGATRYYLGRMTYAVGDYCDGLRRAWLHLPASTQALIRRDVEAEFARDDRARSERSSGFPMGHDCDRAAWERVRALWADSAPNARANLTDTAR